MLTTDLIRIMIVDDHPVVRDGVITQLQLYPEMVVVGYAADGASALRVCAETRPDMILLDLRLPDGPTDLLVPRLRQLSPSSRIVLFTAFPDHAAVGPSLAAGAVGLLVKDVSGPALGAALRAVASTGHGPVPDRPRSSAPITRQEYAVLRLVAIGQTNAEIGEELGLSVNTVKAYLRSVMQRLDARNRAQVITNAQAQGLL
jgi:two-component system nitrate/nitrite response regulator NarL